MNPQTVFCPNVECVAKGQVGKGNISVHSQQEERYRCAACQQTFAATKGTIFYRLQTEPERVMQVLTLLVYGCPLSAIVAAFGFDERTVKDWWGKAGEHCQQVHQHQVESRQFDLGQVQADEIKAKLQGGVLWIAMAIMVSTRLWLGGELSPHRDKALIEALAGRVRKMALCRPLLVAVDGLPSYVGAFYRAFRTKLPRAGKLGRCKLRPWPELNLVQVVKQGHPAQRSIQRRIVLGCAQQVTALIQLSQGRGSINTAFIERLNATCRQRLAHLTRRTRALAGQPQTLHAGLYIWGCVYNFCTYHHALRVPFYLAKGQRRRRWLHRTPAIAAGLTDHRWAFEELFRFKVPPPFWRPPKRRGRPAKATLALIQQWAS
jgi:transposase-like protein